METVLGLGTKISLREQIRGLTEESKDRFLQAFATLAKTPIHINSRVLSYKCYEIEIVFKDQKTYGYGPNEHEAKMKALEHFVDHALEDSQQCVLVKQAADSLGLAASNQQLAVQNQVSAAQFATSGSKERMSVKKKEGTSVVSQRRPKGNVSMDLTPIFYTHQTENSPRPGVDDHFIGANKMQLFTKPRNLSFDGAAGISHVIHTQPAVLETQQNLNHNDISADEMMEEPKDEMVGNSVLLNTSLGDIIKHHQNNQNPASAFNSNILTQQSNTTTTKKNTSAGLSASKSKINPKLNNLVDCGCCKEHKTLMENTAQKMNELFFKVNVLENDNSMMKQLINSLLTQMSGNGIVPLGNANKSSNVKSIPNIKHTKTNSTSLNHPLPFQTIMTNFESTSGASSNNKQAQPASFITNTKFAKENRPVHKETLTNIITEACSMITESNVAGSTAVTPAINTTSTILNQKYILKTPEAAHQNQMSYSPNNFLNRSNKKPVPKLRLDLIKREY